MRAYSVLACVQTAIASPRALIAAVTWGSGPEPSARRGESSDAPDGAMRPNATTACDDDPAARMPAPMIRVWPYGRTRPSPGPMATPAGASRAGSENAPSAKTLAPVAARASATRARAARRDRVRMAPVGTGDGCPRLRSGRQRGPHERATGRTRRPARSPREGEGAAQLGTHDRHRA